MAAESERPPYLHGASGRTRDAKDPEAASDPTELANDSDMGDLPHLGGKSSTLAMTQVPKLAPSFPVTSASPSSPNSVVSSRESSPVRKSSRTVNSSAVGRVRSQSRKSSQDRPSPTRSSANGHSPSTTTPSAPRESAHPDSTPVLPPPASTDSPTNVLSPEKTNMPLRAGNRRTDSESTPPNTSLKRSSTRSPPDEHGQVDRSAPRAVTRGASGQGPPLETVQELASNPSTPSGESIFKPSTPDDSRLHTIDEDPTPRALKQNAESGSDSGGNRSSGTKDEEPSNATGTTKPAKTLMPQRSTASLSAGARNKPADGSVRNMVVETETSLWVWGPANVGTPVELIKPPLRSRASEETIRMLRKERNPKKRRINPPTGPTSSKADIFEAKVASAVDEADVSDSDETFVYESNPPDPFPARQRRYHSRTPSATSMASQADQRPVRVAAISNGNHSVTGKRSMKFTNNTYNGSLDGESIDGDAVRNTNASGTVTPRHLHLGRSHRTNGGGYQSIFDSNSPFPHQQHQPKSPRHVTGSIRHSRSSPRSNPGYKTFGSSKQGGDVYDFEAEGADDEGTPLVTPRPPRSRAGRRPNSTSLRQMEYMAQRQRGYFSRYGSCIIILLLLLIIAGGVTSFIIAATRTLLDVQVVNIQNVLASEQELMLDLNVQAVNPNIFPLTIDDTDLNIFARSRYVGTDKFWREHGSDELEKFPLPRTKESQRRWQFSQIVRCLGNMECVAESVARKAATSTESKGGGVDHGTDPIDDPESDSQTMLLGRVFHFDSPLSFEASPWSNRPSTSKGQIRLPRPGNKTEEGGTERWERVLQHQFDLIARGVIKYQIPLSSRYFSASVNSKVKVVPSDDSNGPDDKVPSNETATISFKRPSSPFLLADPASPDSTSQGSTL
ncbi:hypothetical protein N7468_005666 [Penicillium chermesinum]|uniref:Phospholipid metabolism enzyme regulator n=1 Tax=Penicillium chermesinum TaxID=63820 RepID=A0A9W9P091_9EURO|nr:uncharacterized protein N7468_005666 [Penicillium chermesinum]KAJ5232710.1 hypothetical protein N7468_005666 [Penicillium chermesinum]